MSTVIFKHGNKAVLRKPEFMFEDAVPDSKQ